MGKQSTFSEFDECIQHFKDNPPAGAEMELDFSAEEIEDLKRKATEYGCTVDAFLNAVLACFMNDEEHKERRAASDALFVEARAELRRWVLKQAEKQGKRFEKIESDPEIILDGLIRAARLLGFETELLMSDAKPGQPALVTVNLAE